MPFKVASSFWLRVRGLLGKKPEPGILLLTPCGDVHTFGMRYPIDVAFVDLNGMVIEAHRGVKPNRRLSNRKARVVIERFSDKDSAWISPGEVLLVGARERSVEGE